MTGARRGRASAGAAGRLSALAFGALAAAVFAQFWFASAPLPLGGPNIVLGAAAAALAGAAVALRFANAAGDCGVGTAASALRDRFRPIIPIAAVAAALAAWALAVYAFTDTLGAAQARRLAHIALGIGVLMSAYAVAAGSGRRAVALAIAVAVAGAGSALFGIAMTFVREPFLSVWLSLASVQGNNLDAWLIGGRMVGLAPNTIALAQQLTLGIPIAFAALLYGTFGRGRGWRAAWDAAAFIALAALATALVATATRGALAGALAGMAIAALPAVRAPRAMRRLAVVCPLLAVWMFAVFNPIFAADDVAGIIAGGAGGGGRAAGGGGPAVYGLAAGVGGLTDSGGAGGGAKIGHTISYLVWGQEYELQLRARGERGFGPSAEAAGAADGGGALTIVWDAPDAGAGVLGYQFRLRRAGAGEWRSWRDMDATLSGAAPPIMGLAAAGAGDAALGARGALAAHTITGLTPGVEYAAQVRARGADGFGAYGEAVGSADGAGGLALAWRRPADGSAVGGYQIRIRPTGIPRWRLWRSFALSADGASLRDQGVDRDAAARAVRDVYDGNLRFNRRVVGYSTASTQARLPMAAAALRYSLDYPLGTGVYAPTAAHINKGLSPGIKQIVLTRAPHNQFLLILVYYGFPGLVLLAAFYLLVGRSLMASGKAVFRDGDRRLRFLWAGVFGAMAAYGLASMTNNEGPFLGDWGHFIIIGLAFAIERIAARDSAGGAVDGVAGANGAGA